MISKEKVIDLGSQSEADGPESEVTPAMIEAGVSALSSHWTELACPGLR